MLQLAFGERKIFFPDHYIGPLKKKIIVLSVYLKISIPKYLYRTELSVEII